MVLVRNNKQNINHLIVQPDEAGRRLDVFLTSTIGSRTRAAELIQAGEVIVDGKIIGKPAFLVVSGQKIAVTDKPKVSRMKPTQIDLSIIFENEDVIVLDKPTDLITHPGISEQENTLANALLARWQDLPGCELLRPGIVHRLDRDTSGVIIAAKNEVALRFLQGEFKERRVEKTYETLVSGVGLPQQGIIDSPIIPQAQDRTKMRVASGAKSKPAVTHFTVLTDFPEVLAIYLRVGLETGRTHQIRVHLSAIGHPVLGDDKYGNIKENKIFREQFGLQRQFLHARSLRIKLPNGEVRKFESELAEDLREILFKIQDTWPKRQEL